MPSQVVCKTSDFGKIKSFNELMKEKRMQESELLLILSTVKLDETPNTKSRNSEGKQDQGDKSTKKNNSNFKQYLEFTFCGFLGYVLGFLFFITLKFANCLPPIG